MQKSPLWSGGWDDVGMLSVFSFSPQPVAGTLPQVVDLPSPSLKINIGVIEGNNILASE